MRRSILAFAVSGAAFALAGCFVAAPDDMTLPGPEGDYVLDITFSGGGLTLRRGLSADLSLGPRSGGGDVFATLSPVRQLQVAWVARRALRICAEGAETPANGPVTVSGPGGPATFEITYACPARPI